MSNPLAENLVIKYYNKIKSLEKQNAILIEALKQFLNEENYLNGSLGLPVMLMGNAQKIVFEALEKVGVR